MTNIIIKLNVMNVYIYNKDFSFTKHYSFSIINILKKYYYYVQVEIVLSNHVQEFCRF